MVLAQLVSPFASGGVQAAAIDVGVLAGGGAAAAHAIVSRRLAWGLSFIGGTLATGLVVELVAAATAFPFGAIAYGSTLGPGLGGVPLLVPVGWLMIVYPSLLAAQRLSEERIVTALLAAASIAFWHLLWDAQLTAAGAWSWPADPWTLPGTTGMPLQALLGWLLVGFLLTAGLDRLPRRVAKDGVPTAMLSWLYGWGVVAAIAALHSPGTALWGLVGMGIAVVPWWWRSWSEPQW